MEAVHIGGEIVEPNKSKQALGFDVMAFVNSAVIAAKEKEDLLPMTRMHS